jgi:hypothetical protein
MSKTFSLRIKKTDSQANIEMKLAMLRKQIENYWTNGDDIVKVIAIDFTNYYLLKFIGADNQTITKTVETMIHRGMKIGYLNGDQHHITIDKNDKKTLAEFFTTNITFY